MPDCTKPTEPSSSDPVEDWVEWAIAYGEYLKCLAEKEQSVCDEVDDFITGITTTLNKLTFSQTPLPPLSLTPSGDCEGIIGQFISALNTADGYDLGTESGRRSAQPYVQWVSNHIGNMESNCDCT